MQYQFRKLESWPGKKTPDHERRSKWTFKAKWQSTLDLLAKELLFLDCRNVVIQAYVDDHQIRNDGMLRSGASPRFPGVILSFDSKHGPLSYPCDTCENWQHNVRSIALALQALRSVDRYGVTRRAEQYKGWGKLPAPGQLTKFESTQAAKEFILDVLGCEPDSRPEWPTAIRNAKAIAHPDQGGNARQFKMVCEAEQMISGAA